MNKRRKTRWLLGAGSAICLVAWLAFAVGMVMDLGLAALFALATVAAVLTEGLLWLAAALLGMRAFQARRYLWERVREWIGGPPAADQTFPRKRTDPNQRPGGTS